ncbi:uncharacterized protein LOC111071632 [Drosophila obscura]|uniref:uncharacterized protein LOC111071632 n=1 Tax=Drosophila obscura TaxID=7282 RepID=UPI001BB2A723|nr:uncharacterized protein LOC111071632 [Drosophila obscura]
MDNINEIASEAALANAGTERVSHFAFGLDNSHEGVRELPHGPISVAVATRTFTDEEFGYASFQRIFGEADDDLLSSPLQNLMMQEDEERARTLNTPEPAPTAPNTPINFDVDMDHQPILPELHMEPQPVGLDGVDDHFQGMNDGHDSILFTIAQISRFM